MPAGEHGVGRLRAGVLERFYGKEVMDLFRAVKRAYDPLSILNPGVIIPATDWSPVAALKVGADAAAIVTHLEPHAPVCCYCLQGKIGNLIDYALPLPPPQRVRMLGTVCDSHSG